MNIYYVYIYYDYNKIPFYIGIGKGNRITNHLRKSIRFSRKNLFYNKLNKIIENKENFSYSILRNNLILGEAIITEEVLIKLIGRRDLNTGTLCNLTDGGEGHKNYKKSEELRKKISEWTKGRKISEEQKQILKICNTGKKHSEETKLKLSKVQLGTKKPKPIESRVNYRNSAIIKWKSEDYKNKFRNNYILKSCSVIQLDKQNNIIKIWDTYLDAKYKLGYRTDRILDVCRGINKTYKGYKWKFKEQI